MSTQTLVRLRRGDRVAAAGLTGTVEKARAGTADGDRLYGQPDPLTAVRWDGQSEVVAVRTRLLQKLPRRDKAATTDRPV